MEQDVINKHTSINFLISLRKSEGLRLLHNNYTGHTHAMLTYFKGFLGQVWMSLQGNHKNSNFVLYN